MNILFIKGIITGLILSVPFGAVGLYCMEKTLVEGEVKGYLSALGMVTADLIYGAVALLFVNILKHSIEKFGSILVTALGVIMLVIGVRKFFTNPEPEHIEKRKSKKDGLFQDYITVFLFALMNVQSILFIVGIYTILDKWLRVTYTIKLTTLGVTQKIQACFFYAGGIFLAGAALWFLTTFILYHWRKKITMDMIIKITKFSGLGISVFGIITIIVSIKNFIKAFF
ncbi:MAG: LysE family transporter [Fusobacteriaceae bacterium]